MLKNIKGMNDILPPDSSSWKELENKIAESVTNNPMQGGNNEEEKVKGPSTVNNALFVGSTSELSKLLKAQSKKEDK